VRNIINAPGRSTKKIQADKKHGFVSIYPLGLHEYNGCGSAAVEKRQEKILQFAYAHTSTRLLEKW